MTLIHSEKAYIEIFHCDHNNIAIAYIPLLYICVHHWT